MYRIIGADGREYGPVDAEQIRRWITEGRANAQTMLRPEGSNDWKSLATFPEFAPLFQVPPLVTPPPQMTSKPPGTEKKIVAGLCGILLGQLGIHKFILGYTDEGITMLVITVCCIPAGILTCGVGFLGIVAMHVIGLIEGIIYLTKSDADFITTYVTNKKGWF